MKLKFVSDAKPADYANRLYDVQKKIRKHRRELRALEAEADKLSAYLVKYSKGKSFAYDGPEYQMEVRIEAHSRMILDNEKVQQLLKSRTPYRESRWTSCKVDFIYED